MNNRQAETQEPLLTVRDVSVRYDGIVGVENVSFEVRSGEMLAVIGPNGAGKSSLMKALMGLLPHTGEVVACCPLGYVPQQDTLNWDFPVTLRDAVMMGRTQLIGWLRWPGAAQWRVVDEAIARVGLSDLAERPVGSLSGGQKRRLFIARALAQEAQLLILDEPFSGVDASAQDGIMAVSGLIAPGRTQHSAQHARPQPGLPALRPCAGRASAAGRRWPTE